MTTRMDEFQTAARIAYVSRAQLQGAGPLNMSVFCETFLRVVQDQKCPRPFSMLQVHVGGSGAAAVQSLWPRQLVGRAMVWEESSDFETFDPYLVMPCNKPLTVLVRFRGDCMTVSWQWLRLVLRWR